MMSTQSVLLTLLVLFNSLSFVVSGNPCSQNSFVSYSQTNISTETNYSFETHLSFHSVWKSSNVQIPHTLSSQFALKLYTSEKLYISYSILSNNYKILSPTCQPIKSHNINYQSSNKLLLTITKTHISLTNTSSAYSITCQMNEFMNFNITNNEYNEYNLYIQHENALLFSNKPFIISSHSHYGVNNSDCLHRRRLLGFGPWIDYSALGYVLPTAESHMAAGLWNGVVYLIGGSQNPTGFHGGIPSEVKVLSAGIVTTSIISYSQTYSQLDEIIYMINADGATLSTFDLSQPLLTSPWLPLATNVWDSACIAAFEQHLYIVGGGIRGGIKTVQVYSLSENTWLTINNELNHARYYLSCVVHPFDRMLYALGGNVVETSTERISIDGIANEQWQNFSMLAAPVLYSRAVTYNEFILVIGGQNGVGGSILNIMSLMNINGDPTATAPTTKMLYSIKDTAVVILDDVLYTFGGTNATFEPTDLIEYMDLITLAPTLRPTRDTQSPSQNPSMSPTISTLTPTAQPSLPTISPTKNPSFMPTLHPTLAPTPSCLSLMVSVDDANGQFDEAEFNGLYTYIESRTHFGRPLWEIYQDPDGQNVKFYNGRWIIHGSGYDSLSYSANTHFPPIQDLTAEWSHSNVDNVIFHVLITCVESYAPTSTPTAAPVENDAFMVVNRTEHNYDSSVSIIYVLTNLTHNEYEFVVNYENNNALVYISNVIESHYLHVKYLPKLEYFRIKIEKLNRINISDDSALTVENVYNYNPNALYIRSELYFQNVYEFYLLTTSRNIQWHRNVTKTFRSYFNSTILNFSVANSSSLTAASSEETISKSFKTTFSIMTAFLAICVMVGLLAWLYNKYSTYQYILTPVDCANWFAIIFYGIQIYDIVSDINLTSEMFLYYSNNETGKGNLVILSTAVAGLIFLLIPYSANVYYAAQIPRLTRPNIRCRIWLGSNMTIFITLVIFSGGCIPALDLLSSGIFGMSLFETGLSSFELNELQNIRVLTTVLTENIPQLIIQVIYSSAIGILSPNTILAFCTSFASICGALIIYFINRDKKGKVHNVDYYLEVKHYDNSELSHEERRHIQRHKGMKENLTQEIVNLYENVDITTFELGFVTLRNDDFLIRIVQNLHEEDLPDNLMKTNEFNIEDDYELYCYNLYKMNKKEICGKIFAHYNELDCDQFDIEYHTEYPASLELLKSRSMEAAEGAELMHINLSGEAIKNKVSTLTLTATPNDNDAEVMSSSHYEFWHDRRDEFQRGYKLIKQEIEILQTEHGNNYKINSMQIDRFIRILNTHNINPIVIEDVLNFAVQSNTFHKERRRNSDIDITHTLDSQSNNDRIDQEIEAWAKENNHY